MHNLSNKGQFFILTAVVIVGAFYVLSTYINPYSFIDTSTVVSNEAMFFENVKAKANKTVQISQPVDLENNLASYKDYVQKVAGKKGYTLVFSYDVQPSYVNFVIVLTSDKKTLKADFNVAR